MQHEAHTNPRTEGADKNPVRSLVGQLGNLVKPSLARHHEQVNAKFAHVAEHHRHEGVTRLQLS